LYCGILLSCGLFFRDRDGVFHRVLLPGCLVGNHRLRSRLLLRGGRLVDRYAVQYRKVLPNYWHVGRHAVFGW
jgi:hypothetical protein